MQRWDGDDRGRGVAEAAALVPEVAKLVGAMEAPDWIAEDPELHLLPHLRHACGASGSAFVLEDASTVDASVLVVSLRWRGEGDRRTVTQAVWALLGSVIETSAFVHGPADDEWGAAVGWDVVTGMLRPDTAFEPHGHTLRLVVHGAP